MSIRIALLSLTVAFLGIYAWRDWFKSLCGLVLLMAVIEHEDMPKSILGVQGLNPWNLLMLLIVLAWWTNRRHEGLVWNMPSHLASLLLLYLGVVLAGFGRMMADRSHMEGFAATDLINEELLNTLKWVIPGLLLYDGCRSRVRVRWGMLCVLAMYALIALQAARRIPPSSVLEHSDEIQRVRLKLCRSIGYSACDMSTFLAGAFWAMMASLVLLRRKIHKVLALGAATVTLYGQVLTGGRAGFIAWTATGLVLCALRWRRFLLVAPVLVVVVPIVFPGTVERALQGFGETDVSGNETVNDYEVTSGRTLIWPYVIERIGESSMMGYGRQAMVRTGLASRLWDEMGESFPHPHNMYLELLLDNGLLGALPVLVFFGLVVFYAASLFRTGRDPLEVAAGGAALALVLAQLVAGIGSQHFYPRESTLGMWAAVFIMLRVWVERSRAPAGVLLVNGVTADVPRPRAVRPVPALAPHT